MAILRVHKAWEEYLHCHANVNALVKSQKLDKFLLRFHELIDENKVVDFSKMKSVCNILSGEFLVDVHRICSETDGSDGTIKLHNYLLHGRGCVILRVLNTIGVKGLSSGRELAELLLSILPLCLKFSRTSKNQDKEWTVRNITSCFAIDRSVTPHQRRYSSKFPTVTEMSSKKDTKVQTKEVTKRRKLSPLGSFLASTVKSALKSTINPDNILPPGVSCNLSSARIMQSGSETTESDSEQHSVHVTDNIPGGNQLGVFRGILSPATSDNDPTGKGRKEKKQQTSVEIVPLPDFDVDPMELCQVILNVITAVCQDDSRRLELATTKHVSVELLPHLGQLLSLVHDETENLNGLTEGWTVSDYLEIERLLIRVILSAMYALGLQTNGVVQLQNIGIIQTLVALGLSHRQCVKDSDKQSDVIREKRMLICSELNEGIFTLVVAILKNIAVNPSAISTILYILKDYATSFGFDTCQQFLSILNEEYFDSSSSSAPVDKSIGLELIQMISSLITEMKKVKISYIHTVKCSKKSHKNCDYSPWKQHHHDILNVANGNNITNFDNLHDDFLSGNVSGTSCMINVVVEFLLDTLNKCNSKSLRLKVLSCLEECGICCCISPSIIVKSMLTDIEQQSPSVRNYTMTLLCRLLLEQCGGQRQVSTQQHKLKIQCHVCESSPNINDSVSSLTQPHSWDDSIPAQTNLCSMSDSAFSSGENSFQLGSSSNLQTKWNCLQDLREVVFSVDPLISIQTMQHILKLVCQGNDAVKMQIFQSIFIPILASLPNGKLHGAGALQSPYSVPEKVVNYCLNSLPLLLQVMPVFHHFINIGGIKKLCGFLQESCFRSAACKVFQMMVMLEERFEEANKKRQAGYATEIWMEGFLRDEISPDLDSCTRLAEADVLYDTDEKDICIDTVIQLLNNCDIPKTEPQEDYSVAECSNLLVQDSGNTSKVEELKQDEIICELWNSANILLTHSHKFKKQFLSSTAPRMAFKYLKECLDYISSCTCDIESGVFDSRNRSTKFACKISLLHSILNVCLTCQKHGVQVNDKEEMDGSQLLLTLRKHILKSHLFNGGNSAGFKVVCDLLLSCSTGQHLMGDLVQSHAFSIMHLKLEDEVIPDKDVIDVSESSSRDSEVYLTERGYEADSEISAEDYRNNKNKVTKEPKNKIFINLLSGLAQPEFSRLVMELLIQHHKKHCDTSMVTHVLLKLINTAKANPHNASALYNQGLVKLILEGFQHVLSSKSEQYQAERRILLDLFLVISQHSFLSKELHMYLQLFKEKDAPVELLLKTLTLLARTFQLQPSYILCFPVIQSNQASDLRLSQRSLSQETLSVSMQVMNKSIVDDGTISRFQYTYDLDTLSLGSSVQTDPSGIPALSPLRCAPIELKLDTPPMWPGVKKNFSAALWIRLEGLKGMEQHDSVYSKQRKENLKADLTSLDVIAKDRPLPPKLKAVLKKQHSMRYWSDQCIHMLSVGNQDLLLEVWIEPDSYSLVFRLVSHVGDNVKVLTEGAVAHLFEAKKWHHLTITLSEVPHASKHIANVTSILDGCNQNQVSLEYTGGLKAYSSRSTLYLGHSMSPQQCAHTAGTWQLGNVMFFKDCHLTKHTSFHLYTMGPNTVSLSQCDSGEQQAVYSHFITEHSLKHSSLSHDIFTGNHSIYMHHLRDNLVAVYSPQNTSIYQQYSYTQPASGINAALAKYEPGQFHLFQQPSVTDAGVKTDMAPQQHLGLRVAVQEIGGIGVFLFLAAKVIGDEKSTENDQAEALNLVFTLLSNSPQHYMEFTDMGGYAMLAKALSTGKCKLGFRILKVLMDACLSSSVIQYNKITDTYSLKQNTSAVIKDTQIVDHILLAWKVWETADPQVWCMVFECLANLVSSNHSHQAFNVAQLELIRTIEKLTVICLERIQDGYPSLPVQICECMLTVIQHVISSSTDDLIHHVITVWDFLLLVHPAASAFVFHTPSDFYFKNKWGVVKKRILSAASSFTTSLATSNGTVKADKLSLDDVSEEAVQFFEIQDADISDSSSTVHASQNPIETINTENVRVSVISNDDISTEVKPSSSQNTAGSDGTNSTNSSKRSSPQRDPGRLFLDLTDFVQSHKPYDQLPHMFDRDKDLDLSTKSSSMDMVDDYFRKPSPAAILDERENVNKTTAKCVSSINNSTTAVSLPTYLTKEEKPGKNTKLYSSLPKSDKGSVIEDILTLSENVEDGECRRDYSSPKHVKNALNERSKKNTTLRHSYSVDGSSQTSEEDFARVSPGSVDSEVQEEELPFLQTEALPEGDDVEAGLYVLCAGLVETLATILGRQTQEKLDQIVGLVIKPEVIVVLAHHSSKRFRAGLIQLLDVYLHRASQDLVDSFVKMHGFHLLANQLHQHKTSIEILEACFTILCAKPFIFEDELNLSLLSEVTVVQKHSVILILSLIQNSVTDIALCHNVLINLLKVFEEVPGMASVLLDQGVCEVLCNLIHKLNAAPHQMTDLGGDERDILWRDLEDFVQAIVHKTFSLTGVLYYQYLEDIIHLLTAGENYACATYGVASYQHKKVKTILCVALQAVLDFVDERLDTPPGILQGAKSFPRKVGGFLSRLVLVRENSNPNNLTGKGKSTTNSATISSTNGPAMETWDHFNSMQKFGSSSTEKVSKLAKKAIESKSYESSGSVSSKKGGVHFSLDSFAATVLGKKTEVSHGELLDRFKKLIALAVDSVVYSAPLPINPFLEEDEEDSLNDGAQVHRFPRSLASFLLRGIVIGMDRRSVMQSLFWQTKDTLRIQFSRLYVHMLKPSQDLRTKQFAVKLLASEFKCQEILKLIVNINYTGHKLEYYLYKILVQNINLLERSQREEIEEIMKALQQCGFTPLRLGSKLNMDKKSAMEEDMLIWSREHRREQTLWASKTQTAKNRIFQKHEMLSKRICHNAMEVTKLVNNAQAIERKKFLEHIKFQMSAGLQTKKSWQQLIEQLTHERAVWFDEESSPKSWQLDPTEGPCRVRKRLQRCHLHVKKKFFLSDNVYKHCEENVATPLCYLFEDDTAGADSRALIYKLHTSQNIQHTCLCKNVTPSDSTDGALLVGQNDLYFVADEAIKETNYTQVLLGKKDLLSFTLPHEDIKEIHKRWHQLRDDALEIFMMNGKTCLLSFTNTKERDSIYKLLLHLELPNLLPSVDLSAIQQLWQDKKITNYEYLTHLNKMAGRSYNDLMQYPVLPFVLSQYADVQLNLEDHNIYRNLSKPIAVQHKSREQKYIDNYKWLEQEKQRMKSNPLADPNEYRPEPYHYGSHYSNSGSILHFMVRLPPFTQMFLSYQDNNFDVPDRTFHSLATSWRLASFESTTDVKELVPEFFYLPEFLRNGEGFNFGIRQSGEKVNDVVLPKWCLKDPYLFIKVHRQILESDYVTQNLASWIDLVFGYKQTGRAAIDAINVFHPATYFGVEVDKIVDPLRRNAVKTMIATYGQTPKQLFKSPHPLVAKSQGNSNQKKQKTSRHDLVPLSTVKGLKWGSYVGSPDGDFPRLVWRQNHGAPVCSLVALPTGEVFGLGPRSCLLAMYSKEKGVTGLRNVDVVWASIVSWGHPESVIRLKNKKDMPYINFMHWTPDEQVTCCACVPDCRLLFFGSTSGVISVFNTKFNPSKASHLQVFGKALKLYGHSAPISCLYLCKAYSILVSASHDGTCIIWDLNRLNFVKCIDDHIGPVHTVCVSETLGDIASVSHTGQGSCLSIHTVNGSPIASIETTKELILSLAYSTVQEGRCVNAIVGGLNNGSIKLWSSWELQPICVLNNPESTRPIVSLTYSQDNQRLFASAEDGKVMCWEKPGYQGKEIGFYPYL